MGAAWEPTLRQEFDAHEGSFLLQLRSDRRWDGPAFSRLIEAMKQCAEAYEGNDSLPRWIAQGFWFLGVFARGTTSHPEFPREFEQPYYDEACDRLDELAHWLFFGESPNRRDQPWKRM